MNHSLTRGLSTTCGCVHKTHGHSVGRKTSPTYKSFRAMIQRCTNPNHPHYDNYGGRGIKICDRWLRSFENFLADMGERPKGLTLERKDNSLGYSKSNCKWDTISNQMRNTRYNRIVTVNGITECVTVLCEIFGANRERVFSRLKMGWPPERAFFEPV